MPTKHCIGQKVAWAVSIVGVLSLLIFWFPLMLWWSAIWADGELTAGIAGDSYGPLTALATAGALLLMWRQLSLQRKELTLQREEMRAAREEWSRSAEAQSRLAESQEASVKVTAAASEIQRQAALIAAINSVATLQGDGHFGSRAGQEMIRDRRRYLDGSRLFELIDSMEKTSDGFRESSDD